MAHDHTILEVHYERQHGSLESITVTGPTSGIVTHTGAYLATGIDNFGSLVPLVGGKAPTWASSAPSVVAVDPILGTATYLSPGTANIIATVGAVVSAPLAVTIVAQVVTTVTIPQSPFSLSDSTTLQLTYLATDQDPVSPNTVTGTAAVWARTAGTKATVGASTGLVTGAGTGAGSVTITATVSGVVGTATGSITASAPVTNTVTVSPSPATVQVGSTLPTSTQAFDQYGNPKADTFTYGSSDDTKATVDASGVITGVAIGSAIMTATSVSAPAKSGTTTVSVSATPQVPQPKSTDYVQWDSTPVFAAAAALDNGTPAGFTAMSNAARAFFQSATTQTFVRDYLGIGAPAFRVDLPKWTYSAVVGNFVATGVAGQVMPLTSTVSCNTTTQRPYIDPGTPNVPNANRERPTITAVSNTSTNKSITGTFTKNHVAGTPVGIDFDTTSINGSGFTRALIGSETTYQEPEATFQVNFHWGATNEDTTGGWYGVVPASIGDRDSFEVMNTLAQATPPTGNDGATGMKALLALRDDTFLPGIKLAQNVVGSPSAQTVTVTNTTGLTSGVSGTDFGPASQFVKGITGDLDSNNTPGSKADVNITQVTTNTIRGIFKASRTMGDPLTDIDTRKNDGRWYVVFRGPQPGFIQIQCDTSPYYGNGLNVPVNIGALGLSADAFIKSELPLTMRLKAEAVAGAGTGVVELTVSDTRVLTLTNVKLGSKGWASMQAPATWRSSAFDQSFYVNQFKVWSPNSPITTAPTAVYRNGTPTSLYVNVTTSPAPDGVASLLRPYVWNGSQFIPNNGGGPTDPSFPDVALSGSSRAVTQLVHHTGLTNGLSYQIRYVAVNVFGESPQSNIITQTPALGSYSVQVNLRKTYAFRAADDAANSIVVIPTANNYPFTATTKSTGVTVVEGWNGTTGNDAADRSATADIRLAGDVFNTNTGTGQRTYRHNLPVLGTYTIKLAMGDSANTTNNMYLQCLDGVSGAVLFTIDKSGASIAAARWYDSDATTGLTQAQWLVSTAVRTVVVTGDNPYLLFKLGQPTAMTSPSRWNHAELNLVG